MFTIKKAGASVDLHPAPLQHPDALLVELTKKLSFEMYLAVIRKNTAAWKSAANMRLLQKITWSTEVTAARDPKTGWKVTADKLTHKDAIDYEDAAKPPALTVLPTNVTTFANGDIQCGFQ